MSCAKGDDVVLVKGMRSTHSSIHDIQNIEEEKVKC